jgi:hypothetical protein
MPTAQRCGLHDHQGLAPVEPVGKPGQCETGCVGCAPWGDVAFLVEGQLFAQKMVTLRTVWVIQR